MQLSSSQSSSSFLLLYDNFVKERITMTFMPGPKSLWIGNVSWISCLVSCCLFFSCLLFVNSSQGTPERSFALVFATFVMYGHATKALRYINTMAMFLSNKRQDEPVAAGSGHGALPSMTEISLRASAAAETAIVKRLLAVVLASPRELYADKPLSQKILYAHACLAIRTKPLDMALLAQAESALRWLQETNKVDLAPDLASCDAAKKASEPRLQSNGRGLKRKADKMLNSRGNAFSDRCPFCGELVEWANVTGARCLNGHVLGKPEPNPFSGVKQFPLTLSWILGRCALTFLVIQSPGTSKHCGLCKKEYLRDAFINENSRPSGKLVNGQQPLKTLPSTQRSSQPDKSLIGLLLSACDVCPYCGSKFIS
jgi:hypothetical protein